MNGYYNITTSNQYLIGTVSYYEYQDDNSTAQNYSYVHAELRLSRTNNYETWSNTGGYHLVINGVDTYTAANYQDRIGLNSNLLVASADVKVPHNNDGTKNVTISVYSAGLASFSISEQSKTVALSRIPRASGVTAGEGYIGDTLNISINSASDSFTHNLSYSFGGLSGQIPTGAKNSYNWPIPTSFYAQIPNAKSGIGTITCQTYSGSTLIGTSSCSFTAKCNESDCKPSIGATFYDSNSITVALTSSTKQNPVLVDYFSMPVFEVSSNVKNGATKSQLYISSSTGLYNLNPNATTISQKFNIYDVFSITIVDSRGYSDTKSFQSTDSSQSGYFKRIPYTYLTISANTSRSTQIADDMFVEINGNYFNGNFSDTVENTLAISWKVRERNGDWLNGTTVLTPTISSNNTYNISKTELINPISNDGKWDYQKIYEFEFKATDKLMNVAASDSRPKGQPNFVIYKDKVLLPSGNPILDYEVIDEWEE